MVETARLAKLKEGGFALKVLYKVTNCLGSYLNETEI